MKTNKIFIPIAEFQNAISSFLSKVGYCSSDKEIITKTLMYAELRGNNQGIIKLLTGALYPNHKEGKTVDIIHQTPVSARLNGNQKCGMVVLQEAVNLALEKSTKTGIAVIGCFNYSSATGALGHWSNIITNHKKISIVMSQCPEMVAPYGSYEPLFGTNPIAIGIPLQHQNFTLDMATSASAWFGLEMAKARGESIPNDIAYNSHGNSTTDPSEALKGALRVFDRGFKGSHLSLMVELLAGAWTGAAMKDKKASYNWGSLVIAMDPIILGPLEDFQANAAIMCERLKNAKTLPNETNGNIYLPGERGDILSALQLNRGTIEVDENLYKELKQHC